MCGLSLIVFGFSSFLPLSLLAVTITGFGSMIALAGSNTVIQTIVDESKRGRVMSFFILAFLGLSPFGCMAAGALANVIGAGYTVALTGICTFALAIIFYSRVTSIHLNVAPATIKLGIIEADSELTTTNI
jgi:MFS family permease